MREEGLMDDNADILELFIYLLFMFQGPCIYFCYSYSWALIFLFMFQGPYSGDIAQKMKGEPDAWFQHNMKNPAPDKHPGRTPTAESKKCKWVEV